MSASTSVNDIVITGLPRSGSAVVSGLLDYLPDSVSLNMPPWQPALAQKPLDILPFCKWLVGDFNWTRRQLLELEPVGDFRAQDGTPLFDGMVDPNRKIREMEIARGAETLKEPEMVYFVRKGLSPDFALAMRQHTLFTSILPTLVKFKYFKIIAVIRHPLDVIGSWMHLPQPMLSPGNPPGIARFWPEAIEIMAANMELADRMVQLYDAYLGRYHAVADQVQIVKFEEVIENPQMVGGWFGKQLPPAALARVEKRPRLRGNSDAIMLRESFRKYGVFTKLYYPDI